MKFLFPLLALLLARASLAAEPTIEFTGVMSAGGRTTFQFRDRATSASRWVEIGGRFEDYRLTGYDAKNDTAVLTNGDQSTRLTLITAKIHDGTADAKLTSAQATAIFKNLQMLWAAADQYYLATGKKTATFAELVGPDWKYGGRIKVNPVAGEDYSGLTFDQNLPYFSVTADGGERITLDEVHPGAANESTFRQVQPGDTGMKIARTYGLGIPDLVARNGEVDFSKLKIGQLLRLH